MLTYPPLEDVFGHSEGRHPDVAICSGIVKMIHTDPNQYKIIRFNNCILDSEQFLYINA